MAMNYRSQLYTNYIAKFILKFVGINYIVTYYHKK